ncbi:uncharacterized protein LOC129766751 [Toxorhynchites rutilus septentrionalis]|uniref:uncharacterized protein LOC129766751 n=1 Tax=Toxorhynchites rutilus septentrionalis TaxID=329112 RepID=UPI00247B045C|nr:uncharacterized protein LOC129766751 [Toxorhynchites rutilus septentrionalis]
MITGPTPQQIAARQVVSKELPVFSGDPLDWPLFISSFRHSTETCGYSDSENLLRLQRCLKGSSEQIVKVMVTKLRETPAPKANRMDTLVKFGLTVQNLAAHLRAVGQERHLSNPILLQELVDKLPDAVKFNWALYQQQLPVVDLSTFSDYMAKVASATSTIVSCDMDSKHVHRDDRRPKEKGYVNAHAVETAQFSRETADGKQRIHPSTEIIKKSCSVCSGGNHQATNCATFKKLSVDERWKIVKDRKLCRRCLIAHTRWPCKGEICGVGGCQKRHNRLLHYDPSSTESKPGVSVNATVTIHRQSAASTLFRVIPVTLYGEKGQINTHAFLDDGSSVTLVEQAIVDSLGVEGKTESLCIQWTGGINKTFSGVQRVKMNISGVGSSKQFDISDVYTVASLGLPEQTLDFDGMVNQFKHLRGLPIKSFKHAVPGILIGLSNTHLLATLKLREGLPHEPIATKTRLGWTVYGSVVGAEAPFNHRQMHICARNNDQDLHEYVRSFFSVESLGITIAPEIEGLQNQRARQILESTTIRTASGRFETGLLWKQDEVEFPDSRPMAEKRLRCLEKRLKKDPFLYDKVQLQIEEFQQKGYAHKATANELASFNPNRTWYLPIGIVLNPKKPEKVRLIWDAAAKVKGVGLNTMLLKGPDLLAPLLSVLFQYRQRKVAICSDIKEMFHQILIREEDRSAQLFLWRNNPEDELESQSQYVKNLNAAEYENEYPKAVEAIRKRHYVDDYLESVDTADEAVKIALEVSYIHAKAGFLIRNWISNDRSVLRIIGKLNPTAVKHFVPDKENTFSSERLLGMVWLPDTDVFAFSLNFREDVRRLIIGEIVPTKREMLRVVMSIYDPLGLVASFVIEGKVIVQEVWRAKIDWDDKISGKVFCRWKQWLGVLHDLDRVKIPCCYFPSYHVGSFDTLQLHIFVDASEEAFAAAAYFRIVDRGHVRCALVTSKTKVAPLQPLSIPRLELMAAVIGARMRKTIEEGHTLSVKRTYFWSDSTTVRSWIKSDLRRYRPYVAFRVNEILSLSTEHEWRWVPTRQNPADEATKWGKGPAFDNDCRWYRGPDFLYDNEEEWPKDPSDTHETAEELRPAYVFAHFILKPIIVYERFSKWERLLRCVAYLHRYIGNCQRMRSKEPRQTGSLTREELQKAERSLWRSVQAEVFPDEVATLKRNLQVEKEKRRPLERGSPIATATPRVDDYGILRVDGRMENADCIPYEAKYPTILPKEHRVTKLLLDWYHRKYRHANEATVLNEVKQKFYIPRLRVQIRLVKKQCMWCRVHKTVPVVPQMGPLPRVRLTPFVRPFTFVGIDFFGPYLIKIGRNAVKRWVSLFTCLTVRAVHLEAVTSLSTDSCKKAIRRFIARRGAPQEIFTDNGTNFVGASRELKEELHKMNTELGDTFTDGYTQWRFNPPAAPHMGGMLGKNGAIGEGSDGFTPNREKT